MAINEPPACASCLPVFIPSAGSRGENPFVGVFSALCIALLNGINLPVRMKCPNSYPAPSLPLIKSVANTFDSLYAVAKPDVIPDTTACSTLFISCPI